MATPAILDSGAASTVLWGASYPFPTRSVVKGFGTFSVDNQYITAMEWIVKGVPLIFIGALVAMVIIIDPTDFVSKAVYIPSAISVLALAMVPLFTGFRIKFLPFRFCPSIFTLSAISSIIGRINNINHPPNISSTGRLLRLCRQAKPFSRIPGIVNVENE